MSMVGIHHFTPILTFPHQGGRNNTAHINTFREYRDIAI